jgi:hypothetical protein
MMLMIVTLFEEKGHELDFFFPLPAIGSGAIVEYIEIKLTRTPQRTSA